MKKDLKLKCISCIGDLAYLGKHIYFPDMGVTICGFFTVDYNKEQFKEMPEGVTSEYNIEDWEITCERCLDMMDTFKNIRQQQN